MPETKKIVLKDGSYCLVDTEDFERLNAYTWENCSGYASRKLYPKGEKGKSKRVFLHRELMSLDDQSYMIDHINGDPLDNRKSNLRLATASQNQWNRKTNKNNSSGYKAISWDKKNKKWRVEYQKDKRTVHVGRFSKIADAIKARNESFKVTQGQFARYA